MHIGRAAVAPPERADATPPTLDLTAADPLVVAGASIPTGEEGSQLPHYNPVTDLIVRHVLATMPPPASPSDGARRAYGGAPPPSPVVDLRA